MTAETEDRVFTQKELAARWGVTTKTLQNWFNAGKGPKRISIGLRAVYRMSDVLQYEEDRAQEPGTTQEDRTKREFPEAHRELGAKARKAKHNV